MKQAGILNWRYFPVALILWQLPAQADVLATHRPAHASDTEKVTFTATAEPGITKIVLAIEVYRLTVNSAGQKIKQLVTPFKDIKVCQAPGTVSPCSQQMASSFPKATLVKYRATSSGPQGSSVETYEFAAGTYPWPDDPIPIRVKGGTREKFDLIFIPDKDITISAFRSALSGVIKDLYFKYSVIRDGRGFLNFYYSGRQGDYESGCNFTNPANMATLTATGDAIFFLHKEQERDCSTGVRVSSEINYDKSLVHETGHILFGLKDEYCCDSSYSAQPCFPNLWSSLSACQSAAATIGYPKTYCKQLQSGTSTKPFWRIDPAGSTGCIMGDSEHKAGSDFRNACRRRIFAKYARCGNGNCTASLCQ